MKTIRNGLFVLVILLLAIGIFLIYDDLTRFQEEPFWISATECHPNSDYEKIFSPQVSDPWPNLTIYPLPTISVTPTESLITVQGEAPPQPSSDQFHETFVASQACEITLPDGTSLRLDGIAVSGLEQANHASFTTPPQWLDPVTYLPLNADDTQDWHLKVSQQDRPVLHLHFSTEGEPIGINSAIVFDSATYRRLSWSSSRSDEKFHLDFRLAHQTPLSLALDFAFGPPETKEFRVETGSEIHFQDDTMLQILYAGPGNWNGHTQIPAGITYEHHIYLRPDTEGILALVCVWPELANLQTKFAFDNPPDDWASSHSPFSLHNFSASPSKVPVGQVRHFPNLGRAIFHLAPLPVFPACDNLFEVPIPQQTLQSDLDLRRAIEDFTGVTFSAPHLAEIPCSSLELENATPLDLVQHLESTIGKKIYFHPETRKINTTPPKTKWEKWVERWNGP